ncbi:MAG: hypothetical protein QXP27_00480 [Candidatus Methanomethyliaceae archaeon]
MSADNHGKLQMVEPAGTLRCECGGRMVLSRGNWCCSACGLVWDEPILAHTPSAAAQYDTYRRAAMLKKFGCADPRRVATLKNLAARLCREVRLPLFVADEAVRIALSPSRSGPIHNTAIHALAATVLASRRLGREFVRAPEEWERAIAELALCRTGRTTSNAGGRRRRRWDGSVSPCRGGPPGGRAADEDDDGGADGGPAPRHRPITYWAVLKYIITTWPGEPLRRGDGSGALNGGGEGVEKGVEKGAEKGVATGAPGVEPSPCAEAGAGREGGEGKEEGVGEGAGGETGEEAREGAIRGEGAKGEEGGELRNEGDEAEEPSCKPPNSTSSGAGEPPGPERREPAGSHAGEAAKEPPLSDYWMRLLALAPMKREVLRASLLFPMPTSMTQALSAVHMTRYGASEAHEWGGVKAETVRKGSAELEEKVARRLRVRAPVLRALYALSDSLELPWWIEEIATKALLALAGSKSYPGAATAAALLYAACRGAFEGGEEKGGASTSLGNGTAGESGAWRGAGAGWAACRLPGEWNKALRRAGLRMDLSKVLREARPSMPEEIRAGNVALRARDGISQLSPLEASLAFASRIGEVLGLPKPYISSTLELIFRAGVAGGKPVSPPIPLALAAYWALGYADPTKPEVRRALKRAGIRPGCKGPGGVDYQTIRRAREGLLTNFCRTALRHGAPAQVM